jgi:hypothetical protein
MLQLNQCLEHDGSDKDPRFNPGGCANSEIPKPSRPIRKAAPKPSTFCRLIVKPIQSVKVTVVCPFNSPPCGKTFSSQRACQVHLVRLHKCKRSDQIVRSVHAPRRDICPFCKTEQTAVQRHMARKHPKEWAQRQAIKLNRPAS